MQTIQLSVTSNFHCTEMKGSNYGSSNRKTFHSKRIILINKSYIVLQNIVIHYSIYKHHHLFSIFKTHLMDCKDRPFQYGKHFDWFTIFVNYLCYISTVITLNRIININKYKNSMFLKKCIYEQSKYNFVIYFLNY